MYFILLCSFKELRTQTIDSKFTTCIYISYKVVYLIEIDKLIKQSFIWLGNNKICLLLG